MPGLLFSDRGLETDSEDDGNELRRVVVGEDVVIAGFDECIEPTEWERCADSAIYAELVPAVRVIAAL